MTNTRRGTTASHRSAPRIPARESRTSAVAPSECLHPTALTNACQDDVYRRSKLRLLLFDGTKRELPERLREQVLKYDPHATVKREWASVIDACDAYDVIVDYSDDIDAVVRRINEIWRHRVRENYAIRPAYFLVNRISQYRLVRFEVERLGGHFLHLGDVPIRFGNELEQIRLGIDDLGRSPRWLITYEGNGRTLQVSVSFLGPRGWRPVRQDDAHAAELAVLITTHNGIPRSIAGWRNVMISNPLFKPAGGGFSVPSRTTLRMHIHRDYIRDLQRAFDDARSGFCANKVLERVRLGEKTVGYRIKGRWDAARR